MAWKPRLEQKSTDGKGVLELLAAEALGKRGSAHTAVRGMKPESAHERLDRMVIPRFKMS